MLHFYGSPMSSAGRTHLMLEECGAPFEYHRVNLRDPAQKAEYLKVNPSGKIPFIVDGDVRMPESIAINFYLAEKYAPKLWAAQLEQRALIYAWSLWSISTLQHEVVRVMHHTFIVPQESRSAYEVETGKTNVQRYLDHLETELPASGYLVDGRLTVADLNVASVVNLAAAMASGVLAPKTAAWLDGLKARPAWKKVASSP